MKILIPAKGKSVRCPHKNEILLPYMARYLFADGKIQDAVVLSDSEQIRTLANTLGMEAWAEERTDKDDDLSACRKYMQGCEDEWFFMLPLTQPFKHYGLLDEMLEVVDDKTDFVVTSHMVADRSIFYVKDGEFLKYSEERKGCLCPEREMVDGTAYLIRKEWLNRTWQNRHFWKGRFKTVVNKAPWLDIDTPEDMEKFRFVTKFNS